MNVRRTIELRVCHLERFHVCGVGVASVFLGRHAGAGLRHLHVVTGSCVGDAASSEGEDACGQCKGWVFLQFFMVKFSFQSLGSEFPAYARCVGMGREFSMFCPVCDA